MKPLPPSSRSRWLPVLGLAIVAQALLVTAASASKELPPAPAALAARVGFDQNLGQQVPLDAVFKDEAGRTTSLGDVFHQQNRPTVLILGYHECPMLCSLVLSGFVETCNDLRLTAGEQFTVVDVSIDPTEQTSVAAAQKRTYLKRYGRGSRAKDGWHFLTGSADNIQRVAGTIGFRYAYDPATKQYAHPSGFVVLTPDGKISRYFFGVNFKAQELQFALTAAGAREIGSPIEKLLLLCFHYNPLSGKYGQLIMIIMRTGGVLTMLALAGTLVWLMRNERRRPVPLAATASAAAALPPTDRT